MLCRRAARPSPHATLSPPTPPPISSTHLSPSTRTHTNTTHDTRTMPGGRGHQRGRLRREEPHALQRRGVLPGRAHRAHARDVGLAGDNDPRGDQEGWGSWGTGTGRLAWVDCSSGCPLCVCLCVSVCIRAREDGSRLPVLVPRVPAGVWDVDPSIPSTITSFGPGYIDQPNEVQRRVVAGVQSARAGVETGWGKGGSTVARHSHAGPHARHAGPQHPLSPSSPPAGDRGAADGRPAEARDQAAGRHRHGHRGAGGLWLQARPQRAGDLHGAALF
jgi:hypothetical protein